MKRKLLAIMMAVCVTASFAGGSATVFAAQEESTAKDEVIVTMPTTSEPESGFDPAYGWGAGEHVHEPLIQSTLTTTNTDLSIGISWYFFQSKHQRTCRFPDDLPGKNVRLQSDPPIPDGKTSRADQRNVRRSRRRLLYRAAVLCKLGRTACSSW